MVHDLIQIEADLAKDARGNSLNAWRCCLRENQRQLYKWVRNEPNMQTFHLFSEDQPDIVIRLPCLKLLECFASFGAVFGNVQVQDLATCVQPGTLRLFENILRLVIGRRSLQQMFSM